MPFDAPHADVAFSYAPGKVILVGEHAVVYGASAIAMPIELGVRVAVSRHKPEGHEGPVLRGVGPFLMGDVTTHASSPGPKILKSALVYLREHFGDELRHVSIVVDGNVPPGRGLGSSASLSVAMIRALFRYFSRPLSDQVLRQHALALETIFHGSPSGIDHTVVINDQVIGFRREGLESLVWPIPLQSSLKFIIACAGPHDGTKNAVLALAERRKRHASAYERIFRGLHDIAEDMEKAIKEGHQACLGELMNMAQGYLNALSLSTPEMEKLCAIARERGALGAKLTGAGGGGAIIALIDHNESGIQSAFSAAGYQSFVVEIAKKDAS